MELIDGLKEDFCKMLNALPEDIKPSDIRVLADIGSVITAAKNLTGKKDYIAEELEDAEERYMQYVNSQDPAIIQ
ncbi:hypothetical protein AGMMS50212_16410 [Spirochaetia bacterium]|nr:hypothetical protein AGMMS50212_16410 [Spirochaetia bacterium]